MSHVIPLTSLSDILCVASDEDFEQILRELPGDLRTLRQIAKKPGHAGFKWPIKWRREGGPSTVTTHCTDGTLAPRPLQA